MADRTSNLELDDTISTGRIELIVDPEYGDLWSGPVPIVRGTELTPLQEIRVEVSCRDGKGRLWKSSNNFLVSADGIFDTSQTAAMGDGYYGISPEAILNSMLCVDGPGYDFSRETETLEYRFACFDGNQECWSAELTRRLGRAESDRPKPWVEVVLFDDANQREATAALSSYGVKIVESDQPAELPRFVVGSGRASARALEVALRSEKIEGVVLFSGSGLRFDALTFEQELDYATLYHSSLRPKAEGVLVTRTMYAEAVADKANRERGRIEVEKIACPIYLFSGADDQIWPASAFSELVAQRRKMAGCIYPTLHRTYEGVGHDLGPSLGLPTLPTTERSVSHPETGFRLLLGGKMGRQGRACRECWDALMTILAGRFGEIADPEPDSESLSKP